MCVTFVMYLYKHWTEQRYCDNMKNNLANRISFQLQDTRDKLCRIISKQAACISIWMESNISNLHLRLVENTKNCIIWYFDLLFLNWYQNCQFLFCFNFSYIFKSIQLSDPLIVCYYFDFLFRNQIMHYFFVLISYSTILKQIYTLQYTQNIISAFPEWRLDQVQDGYSTFGIRSDYKYYTNRLIHKWTYSCIFCQSDFNVCSITIQFRSDYVFKGTS